MLGLATISFVLLLVVVYYIARPWLVPQVEAEGIRAVELRDRRDRLAASLTDLDMEFSTGKLAVEDYEAQREGREREFEEAERELDALGEPADGDRSRSAEADPDDELERLIAARRRELAHVACPACGTTHDPEDRFCRSCGTELSEVTPT
ncbi:MAG: zinc ribbon domain-containing protein [Planctomycetaceae bacterium]